jgi:hypothetical protein
VCMRAWERGVEIERNDDAAPERRSFCVSICTSVPVKLVNRVPKDLCDSSQSVIQHCLPPCHRMHPHSTPHLHHEEKKNKEKK